MKVLYLLRHAKSSWDNPGVADFDRPLNKRGRRAAKAMAKHFRKSGVHPAAVLCSPAVRARQTLEPIAPTLDEKAVTFDRRVYEANWPTLLACLADLPASLPSVLLIGHNPGLQQLARHLVGDDACDSADSPLSEKFPTGSLAALSTRVEAWRELRAGTCHLDSFVRPADLPQ